MSWAAYATDTWTVLLGGVLAYFGYHYFFHPLAGIPGPLSARLGISWFRFYSTFTRNYSSSQYRMHQKYGPVVRLGRSFVSVTNPEAVHAIYAHGSRFHKADFYSSFGALEPRNMSTTESQSQVNQHRSGDQISPEYIF